MHNGLFFSKCLNDAARVEREFGAEIPYFARLEYIGEGDADNALNILRRFAYQIDRAFERRWATNRFWKCHPLGCDLRLRFLGRVKRLGSPLARAEFAQRRALGENLRLFAAR